MKILIADDYPDARDVIKDILVVEFDGVEFLEASSYDEAAAILEDGGITCFVTDKNMPPLQDAGLQLLEKGKELGIPGLLLSAETAVVEALAKRGVPALAKPISSLRLVEEVRKLLG